MKNKCVHCGRPTNDLYTIDGRNKNTKESCVPVCDKCDKTHHKS